MIVRPLLIASSDAFSANLEGGKSKVFPVGPNHGGPYLVTKYGPPTSLQNHVAGPDFILLQIKLKLYYGIKALGIVFTFYLLF